MNPDPEETPRPAAKRKPKGPPIPAKVLRSKADRHRQRKPSWNRPRRGRS